MAKYSQFVTVCRPTNGDTVRFKGPEINVKLGWFLSDIWCDNSEAYTISEIRKSHTNIQSFVYDDECELLKGKKVVIGSPKHKNFTGDDEENIIITVLFEKYLKGKKEVFGDYSVFVEGIGYASSSQTSGSSPSDEMIELTDYVDATIWTNASASVEDGAIFLDHVLGTPFCGLRKFLRIDWYYDYQTFEDFLESEGITKAPDDEPKEDARNDLFNLPDPEPRKKRSKKK